MDCFNSETPDDLNFRFIAIMIYGFLDLSICEIWRFHFNEIRCLWLRPGVSELWIYRFMDCWKSGNQDVKR